MGWKERYRQASFRGVEFYVSTHEATGGRRISNHEYPLRDTNYAEDLGRKSRTFLVEAYVLGDDYFEARDSLISAMEAVGPGELVHPYLGQKTVVVDGFRLRENNQSTGIAEFSISFIEAGLRAQPQGITNYAASIAEIGDSLISAAQAQYIQNAIVQGVPEFVRDGLRLNIQSFGGVLEGINNGGLLTRVDPTQTIIDTAADFQNVFRTLKNFDVTSVLDVSATAETIISALKSVFDLAPSAAVKTKVMQLTQTLEIQERDITTVNIQRQNQNSNAVKDLIDYVAIAQQAASVESQNYAAYRDAIAARNDMVDRIDAKIETADDEIYSNLRSLRSEIINSVPKTAEDLPRIATVTIQQRQSSLLVAYREYGTAQEEQSIVERNKLVHPGFLPAQTEIEVLRT